MKDCVVLSKDFRAQYFLPKMGIAVCPKIGVAFCPKMGVAFCPKMGIEFCPKMGLIFLPKVGGSMFFCRKWDLHSVQIGKMALLFWPKEGSNICQNFLNQKILVGYKRLWQNSTYQCHYKGYFFTRRPIYTIGLSISFGQKFDLRSFFNFCQNFSGFFFCPYFGQKILAKYWKGGNSAGKRTYCQNFGQKISICLN